MLDLHGNANKKEQSPDGSEDKNVFDIQQGVAICLATRGGSRNAGVQHADLGVHARTNMRGSPSIASSNSGFAALTPDSPFYFFEPQNTDCRPNTTRGWKINDVDAGQLVRDS